MIEISLVPSEHVMRLWHEVAPMLQRSVDRSSDRASLEDVLHDILDAEQSLWIALDGCEIIGCCTVRITKYQTGLTTLSYEHLAGENVDRWIDEGHRVLQNYAKEFGCQRLEVPQGRQGWAPLLKKLGYRTFAVRYEFEIED